MENVKDDIMSCIILEMRLMGTNFSIYNISVTHPGHCCSVLKILAVLLTG